MTTDGFDVGATVDLDLDFDLDLGMPFEGTVAWAADAGVDFVEL